MVFTENGGLVSVSCYCMIYPDFVLMPFIHSPGIDLGPTNFLNFLKDLGKYWRALLFSSENNRNILLNYASELMMVAWHHSLNNHWKQQRQN